MARQQRPQPEGATPEQTLSHAHVVHGRFEHGDRLLRLAQVCDVVGLGKSVVCELVAAHRFPQPVRLGVSAVRWSSDEIQRWIKEQLDRRTA